MNLSKQEIQERLELEKKIKKNIKEFEKLTEDVYRLTRDYWVGGVTSRFISIICEKYEYGDLIVDDDIYVITQRFEQTSYQQNIGVKEYIAKRLKWNLQLDDQEYYIQEEIFLDGDGRHETSVYHIEPKEKE